LKALILAAGRGERMLPLTLTTPKPLLEVGGTPLIVWHLRKLAAIGIREVIVNTAWLGDALEAALGDGALFDLRIAFSREGAEPLETGGALLHARGLLGESPFLLVNGDVWTDFDFARLSADPAGDAHLVMVPAPPYAASGDFRLDDSGRLHAVGMPLHTYSGIGIFRMALLDDWRAATHGIATATFDPPRFPLLPLLLAGMRKGVITGELHGGRWCDVGTPDRLSELDRSLRQAQGPRD